MIAIKGIKIPRTCGVCKFAYFKENECSWYSCSLLPSDTDEGSDGSYRQPECPLVDIEDIPVSEWIPVNERLPEYRQIVLVSTFWGVTVAQRNAIKEDGTDDFWDIFLDDATTHTRYIHAWMPLPKPYKKLDDLWESDTK